jgi:uncharacterized cupredoxin-like copper-binding protein
MTEMKSSITLIIGIVIGVLIGGATVYFTFPQAMVQQATVKHVTMDMLDFAFGVPSGSTALKVKAGETITVTLTNRGQWDHEFRIVKDRDAYITNLEKVVGSLRPRGIEEQSVVEASPAFKEALAFSSLNVIKTDSQTANTVLLKPGQTKTITFAVDTPGSYSYICGLLDGSFSQTHARRGMYGPMEVLP